MSDRSKIPWPGSDFESVGHGLFEDDKEVCLCSIAISLKRIADALTNTDPYSNLIAQAIQNGLNLGTQDWIGHMARNGR